MNDNIKKIEHLDLNIIRKRLLDLTARNKLLNYRLNDRSSLAIVGNYSDDIYDILMSDNFIKFLPVPNPTEYQLLSLKDKDKIIKKDIKAKEWAKFLGINIEEELCNVKKASADEKKLNKKKNNVQVLLYPDQLNSWIKVSHQKNQISIEERGAGILYLSFGFLTWVEAKASLREYNSPLFIIPVKFERAQKNSDEGIYGYNLYYTGEDIIPNLSLQEKLKNDFGIALPDLNEEEKPFSYIERVRKIIKKIKPEWSVHHYCSLGFLNFSKMMMFLDLDPTRWPQDNRNIQNNPIIKQFFTSSSKEKNDIFQDNKDKEYSIDSYPKIHELTPLIYEADSSQHKAIIDVMKGKNLVIEGPPGCGKSQTITNLIASALANGKTVLFVAEKMTALEVVKKRLDSVGLGQFCLELHSHKTNKKEMLDNLSIRIREKKLFLSEENIQSSIFEYEQYKERLNSYAILINKEWGNNSTEKNNDNKGYTIHTILCKATYHRSQIDLEPKELHIDNFNDQYFDQNQYKKLVELTKIFKATYNELKNQINNINNINTHPWYGVYNTEVQVFDIPFIITSLEKYQNALSSVWKLMKKFSSDWVIDVNDFITEDKAEINLLLPDILPKLSGNEIFPLYSKLASLPNLIHDLENYLSSLKKIENYNQNLKSNFSSEYLANKSSYIRDVKHSLELLKKWGVNGSTSISDLLKIKTNLDKKNKKLISLYSLFDELIFVLPDSISTLMTNNYTGLLFIRDLFTIVTSIPSDLLKYRCDFFDNDDSDELLESLFFQIEILNRLENKLQNTFKLNQLPDISKMQEITNTINSKTLFSIFNSKYRLAKKELLALSNGKKLIQIKKFIPELIEYIERKYAFYALTESDELKSFNITLTTDISKFRLIRKWYQDVRSRYGIGFGKLVVVGNAIISLDSNIIKGIQELIKQEHINERLNECIDDIKLTLSPFVNILPILEDDYKQDQKNALMFIIKELNQSIFQLQHCFTKNNISFKEFYELFFLSEDILNIQIKCQSFERKLSKLIKINLDLTQEKNLNQNKQFISLNDTVTFAMKLFSNVNSKNLKNCICSLLSREEYEQFDKERNNIIYCYNDYIEKMNLFIEQSKLNKSQWFNSEYASFEVMIARNQVALEKKNWLNGWLNFIRQQNEMKINGLSNLINAIFDDKLHIDNIENGLLAAVFDQLSRKIIRTYPDLAKISGSQRNELRELFKQSDKKLLSLQQKHIVDKITNREIPKGYAGGKKSEYTELALIQNEVGKKMRHIPIRQLIKRSTNALQALTPCFMMSPMSVASYLQPGLIEFDLVIMDEASQIKPEDSLGVIARGKQVVIVGDPKQLPPTNIFESARDDEEDDNNAIVEMASILDAGIPLFPTRSLKWHYRSQHESLIAFSNYSFYGGELVIFPSPYADSKEYGITFNYVKEGVFLEQVNFKEARKLVKAVVMHAQEFPNDSIGIVAMNAKQRDQIERELYELSRHDSKMREYIESLETNDTQLFIKNLENVQGDERDVIFISFTYGPSQQGGKVYQRFGPINSDIGWRRLNVLFTRSKKKMIIFSSMRSDDIVNNSSKGVVALKNFLKYAETKQLHSISKPTGKAPDSDFEISVMHYLKQNGFDCEPQVGVSGFYIDLAVIDPNNPGCYLMGIECDGATYHSAKSARDRDRFRQEILENLGWTIRRIWSTDWFINPDEIIAPIIRELNQLKSVVISDVDESSFKKDDIKEVNLESEESNIEKDVIIKTNNSDLRNHLDKLSDEIRKKCLNTPENNRLLRPAMIESLLEFQPITLNEFLEFIPFYLRDTTDKQEAKLYLNEVLDMIKKIK